MLLITLQVLIVEEPLVAMSDEVDFLLTHKSRDLFPNATILIIAHQMKYVMHCDKIMVVENGKVTSFRY